MYKGKKILVDDVWLTLLGLLLPHSERNAQSYSVDIGLVGKHSQRIPCYCSEAYMYSLSMYTHRIALVHWCSGSLRLAFFIIPRYTTLFELFKLIFIDSTILHPHRRFSKLFIVHLSSNEHVVVSDGYCLANNCAPCARNLFTFRMPINTGSISTSELSNKFSRIFLLYYWISDPKNGLL